MPDNVEIKARVRDMVDLVRRAEEVSGTRGEVLVQEDTFFICPTGRLKLRQIQGSGAELIFYDREDKAGPKVSHFHKAGVEDVDNMKEVLRLTLGVRGRVAKERRLYMVGQTRVHVDRVDGLGDFMELEVNLKDGQTPEDGEEIARDLMQKLGVSGDDLLTCAYMDLLLKEKSV